jgi:hypothetical protein
MKNLKGILEFGFKANLCRETIIFRDNPVTYHVPMASFCDIPLSKIINHTNCYGSYGIGMTKEWGKGRRINPIIYLQDKSLLTETIQSSIKSSIDEINKKVTKSNGVPKEDDLTAARITSYIKNYECLKDDGRYKKGYRFYDEREWRFVPTKTNEGRLMLPHYFDEDLAKIENKTIFHETKLDFQPNDIRYLIIENDEEIIELIDHIKAVKKKFCRDDVARLSTRIITYEQIKNDI